MKVYYKYLITFITLLIVEIAIAMFIHDNIIRPFIGDVLIVCVIYFFLRSFIRKSKLLAMYVFLFACFIELSQYFNLVSLLYMEKFKVAKIIIGSTFDLKDIICYFMGTIILFVYETITNK